MLGREKMVQDVIDYLSDVSDAMVISALSARDLVVTRAPTAPSAPQDIRVVGSVKLHSVRGEPISRVKVTVTPVQSDYAITSPSTGEVYRPCISEIPVHEYTDADGVASFHLIVGSTIRVVTSLSSVVREITVPSVDFNLMDSSISAAQDIFSDPARPRTSVLRSDV